LRRFAWSWRSRGLRPASPRPPIRKPPCPADWTWGP